ncbi:hypothetical protein [Treponema phagedenis]|uniref:hypothetical protein n=1 Tax=Treponema phagedenis TaxID=162 RepID=UPI0011F01C53|nr:hypothetical protein [Treponema phagedenis]TYT76798.1 hypothetical protein FS559_12830 [Treponema phagedenis]
MVKTASAEYQHYAVAMYRTIELRTSMIRSTNSGYTVAINPYGKNNYKPSAFCAGRLLFIHAGVSSYHDLLCPLQRLASAAFILYFLVCMLSLKKEKHKNLLLKSAEKNIAEMKYKSVFIKKEFDTTVWF